MNQSLREQLLKAGFKPSQTRHKTGAKPRCQQPAPASAKPYPSTGQRQARREEKARIRQFLREHRLNQPEADIAYYFQSAHGTRHLYVTHEQLQRLIAGQLAILLRNERHHLLSLEHAEKMRRWEPGSDIFIDTRKETTPDADDPYAAFKVPDDLRW